MNFFDLNIIQSGSLRLYNGVEKFASQSGFQTEVTTNNQLLFKEINSGSNDINILYLSSSNREPRIGFGFSPNEQFEKTFEIKSSKDSEFGTELALKSSRITKGGEIGDYAGIIDFIIESGSYEKINISGSIADVKAQVTTISEFGATGDLVLSAAPNPKLPPQEVLRIGGVNSNFSSSLRVMGSNLTVDYNLISDGNTQLNGNTIATNITSSGNISSSGTIIGNNIIGTSFFPVNGDPFTNEVSFFTGETDVDIIGNTILEQTSSVDFKFFRQGEGGYTNNSALELTGSLLVKGNTVMNGSLTITGSQLITDDITSDGTIRARVKSFDIPHPTRKNKRLVYGALEGPEHGIYCRGESKELKVLLPPEWRAMVNTKGVTVQITPIGEWQPLYFKKLQSNWLYFGCGDERENVHFYWEIKGERTDVPKLQTVQ